MVKKIIFIITCLVLLAKMVLAQANTERINYLEKKLDQSSDTERADILNELCFESSVISIEKSMEYGKLALDLSKKLQYRKGEARAICNMSWPHIASGNYNQALISSDQSLKISKEIQDRENIADCLNIQGTVYWNTNKYEKALDHSFRSLKIAEEIGYQKAIAYSLNNIGNIYYSLNKSEKALEYYYKTLETEGKTGNKQGISTSLGNIGSIYYGIGENDKALKYFFKSLKIRKETGDKNLVVSYGNIGAVYIRMGKYDKALEYYFLSLKAAEKIGFKKVIAHSCYKIGKIYLDQKNFNKAGEYLFRSLNIAKQIKAKDIIQKIYESLSIYYIARNDYKNGLKYSMLFHETYVDIYNETSQKQINHLLEEFNAERREKEISLLKKNGEIQRLRMTRMKLLRNAFIIGFILISIIFLLIFKRYLYLFAFWKKKNYLGHFRIQEKIASGGMGIVYKAHKIQDKTNELAVKVIREEYSTDKVYKKRFKHEAAIIDQLDHPNIVKIIERGEYAGNLYIAMELLKGQTLAEILDRGKLPLTVSLHIMSQITSALVNIHGKNIIHRDLKPENVMIIKTEADSYFIKLLDFGLAKTVKNTKLTQTGKILGTLQYMSPEQRISDGELTTKSDIFSLGVIFYELITGKEAFSKDPELAAYELINKMPVEPILLEPTLQVALNQLIMQMIEKASEARPSAEDVFTSIIELENSCCAQTV